MNQLDEREAFVAAVVESNSGRRLIVAGPGTGKTYLFRRILENEQGTRETRLILTFINNLVSELQRDLGDVARVYTFHGYCHLLLRRQSDLRGALREGFRYFPKLPRVIKADWEVTRGEEAPHFVGLMRSLGGGAAVEFYLQRGDYYQAISYDDSVFRAYQGLVTNPEAVPQYDLILVDEYQDFNRLEVELIDLLSRRNRVVIAGDDDQALYSQLRGSDPRFIRQLRAGGDYVTLPLPFCMRCTEVIVGAVNDVIEGALSAGFLRERIDKPYRYYPAAKQADSGVYRKIRVVQTTIQRLGAGNYFGRYVLGEISGIPRGEIDESHEGRFPTVLVIASNPYRGQVVQHLQLNGYTVRTTEATEPWELERRDGLRILREEGESNLGWRIILETDRPAGWEELIRRSVREQIQLVDVVGSEFRQAVLSEAGAIGEEILPAEPSEVEAGRPSIMATSFEGAKGLSAQHVFIVGLHSGELPRDPVDIHDLEICKFVVALTRTRKQCHILYTTHFGNRARRASVFLRWIGRSRVQRERVDKNYWRVPF